MYTSITEDTLSVIKAPPLKHPDVASSPVTDATNNIGTRLFQFRARFRYDDNEKSVWGPVSGITTLDEKFTIMGYGTPWLSAFNRYKITVAVPDDTTVIEMDVAFRIGNNGNWVMVDTVDVSDHRGTDYDYYFRNDKVVSSLSQSDLFRPYDYVPRLAGVQEVIDDSRLVYGNILEGYNNNVTLDVDFSYNTHDCPRTVNESEEFDVDKVSRLKFITRGFWLEASSSTVISIEIIISGDNTGYRYVVPSVASWDSSVGGVVIHDQATFMAQVVEDVSENPLLDSVACVGGDELEFIFKNTVSKRDVLIVKHGPSYIRKSLKNGAKQYFGIVYGDKRGRLGPVLRSEDTEFYIPFSTERDGVHWCNYCLDYSINHKPPDWAYTWRIVYGRSNIQWFQGFRVRTHDWEDKSIWREDGYTKIKINQGLNDVRSVIDNFAIPNYSWTPGDRLRIVYVYDNITVDKSGSVAVSDYVDLEILKFDGTYIYTEDWTFIPGAPNIDEITDDILIEIYRLRPESEDHIYYGVGQVHDINNPGEATRSHADDAGVVQVGECYRSWMPLVYLMPEEEPPVSDITTNTSTTTSSTTSSTSTTSTSTTSTTASFDFYNNKYPFGLRGNSVLSLYQSPFVSDSNQYDLGELHVVDENYREKRSQVLRWGGKLVDLTNINYSNKFKFDDYDVLDIKYGYTYGLRQVGYTLKVIQQSKVTSVYLGYEFIDDAGGTQQLVPTTNVLGSKRPSVTDYGTDFPGTIFVKDRYVYFFDARAGRVIRDAPNGQEVISDIGMKSCFKQLSDDLKTEWYDRHYGTAGFDHENDTFLLSICEFYNNFRCFGFHEPSNRWISEYNYYPDCFGNISNNVLVGFLEGALYRHNSDAVTRERLYGNLNYSLMDIISNINPAVNKLYRAIHVVSNDEWVLNEDGDIIIEPRVVGGSGMRSKILDGDWVNYEGDHKAAFNRDNYGPLGVYNDYLLHNGRELRGRTMKIRLANHTNEDEVNLFLIKVYSSLSR